MFAWVAFGEQWTLNHFVTFDGENKLVYVDPSISELNFGRDVYSAWKEWVQLYDNSKWDAALRTTGGDALSAGQFLGDYYFFINGWRLVISHEMIINGNVFSDDFDTAYTALGDTQLVQNVVSSLTTQVGGGGTGGDCPTAEEIRQEIDANSTRLAAIEAMLEAVGIATTETNTTVNEINTTVDSIDLTTQNIDSTTQDIQNTVNNIDALISSGSFPTLGDIVDGVWNAALDAYVNAGSAGLIVSTILSNVVDSKTRTDEIKIVVDSLLILVDEILKYDRNRTRIDKATKTLTVYDNDGITPIRVFNLLDGNGNLSIEEVCERDPGASPPPEYPITFGSEFSNEFE